MAKARCRITVGREANANTAKRSTACARKRPSTSSWCRSIRIVIPGRPDSGLLPFIQPGDGGTARRRRSPRADLQFPPLLHDQRRQSHARRPRRPYDPALRTARPLSGGAGRAGQKPELERVLESDLDAERQDRHQQQRRLLDRLHRRELRLSRGDYARASDLAGPRGLHSRVAALSWPPARACPRTSAPKCSAGACARTSSPTPAAGRTSSTSARRGGWSPTMS